MKKNENMPDKTKIETVLTKKISSLIEKSQSGAISYFNSSLTILFWKIGKMITEYTLENKRAGYGEQIVVTVSRQLQRTYGRNFEEKNLRRMMQFSSLFPDLKTVTRLSRHLSWSHFLVLLPIKNEKARLYYAMISGKERWSVRDLRKNIAKKVYERKSLASIQMRTDVNNNQAIFKDPYLLDFLNLDGGFLENDLEKAILDELEKFLLELGAGFTFIARQKRMIIDGEDFYLDLLFFHRKVKRLIAVELKLGKFEAKHKGQMELYLKWLDRYEKQPGESTPLGLILCAETSREQVELLEMYKDGIMVAEYWTEIIPKKELENKLHLAIAHAKEVAKDRLLIKKA